MDLAAKLNIPVYETDIEPYDVREADEAWYTSTTICMCPSPASTSNSSARANPVLSINSFSQPGPKKSA